ncbi:MAG: ABC transporter permease [Micromonosporaceae bacterium]
MTALIRSELMKIRTTHVWWAFGLSLLGLTILSVLLGMVEAEFRLNEPSFPAAPGGEPMDTAQVRDSVAANLYTAGQFFGLMFAMLLGTLLMTNEYQHQTASATFLATPDRTRVVFAKLATAVLIGVGLWTLATVIDVLAGATYLASGGFGPRFGHWSVLQAIGLNLVAYALWAVFGVGLGTLIRSQIAAVILAIALYVLTGAVAQGLLTALAFYTEWSWLQQISVLLPYTASELMTEGVDMPDMPPRWVGALVLTSYGVTAGIAGALITRRRDIA